MSWITILRKRAAFRKAFDDFDYSAVARYGESRVRRLLGDASIVRHRGKIEAAIHNAKQAIRLEQEFGELRKYFVAFGDVSPFSGVHAKTSRSTELSKDLRARGWKFVGPTTCYAFMQAVGLVNDHIPGCVVRGRVTRAQRAAT